MVLLTTNIELTCNDKLIFAVPSTRTVESVFSVSVPNTALPVLDIIKPGVTGPYRDWETDRKSVV